MGRSAEQMSGVGIGGLFDLALVLASGFLLCAWEPCRGYLRRQPPPIPYFTFLAVGVIWWVAVSALAAGLRWTCGWSHICLPTFGEMTGFADNQQHGVTVLFWAFVIWVIFWFFAEKTCEWISERQVGGQKISQHISDRSLRHLGKGWEFEKMVNEAVKESIMVMLTLGSRKVYIGIPLEVTRDESGRDRWVSLIPWRSGYRDEGTGKLILTTNYEWMLRKPVRRGAVKFFTMCIPIREVVSSQFFDQSLYERFQLQERQIGGEGGKGSSGGGEQAGEQKNTGKRSARSVNNAEDHHEQGANKQ